MRDRTRLILGSFGLGLVLLGLMLFLGQTYSAIESGRLETVSLGSVVHGSTLRWLLPDGIVKATRRIIPQELPDSLDWLMDHIPFALFLAILGGLVTWRTLLRDHTS